jgi:hypothetical protein
MIMCSHFAPNVRATTQLARYPRSGNEPLSCTNAGGPYLAESEPHSHSSGPYRDATGRTPPHALTGSPLSRRSAPR